MHQIHSCLCLYWQDRLVPWFPRFLPPSKSPWTESIREESDWQTEETATRMDDLWSPSSIQAAITNWSLMMSVNNCRILSPGQSVILATIMTPVTPDPEWSSWLLRWSPITRHPLSASAWLLTLTANIGYLDIILYLNENIIKGGVP